MNPSPLAPGPTQRTTRLHSLPKIPRDTGSYPDSHRSLWLRIKSLCASKDQVGAGAGQHQPDRWKAGPTPSLVPRVPPFLGALSGDLEQVQRGGCQLQLPTGSVAKGWVFSFQSARDLEVTPWCPGLAMHWSRARMSLWHQIAIKLFKHSHHERVTRSRGEMWEASVPAQHPSSTGLQSLAALVPSSSLRATSRSHQWHLGTRVPG